MNEQLIVKNFGPIKDATVDFKRVTVFIGPTGGGKSTLAKLAAVFREPRLYTSGRNGVESTLRGYGIDFVANSTLINWQVRHLGIGFLDGKWELGFQDEIRAEILELARKATEFQKQAQALAEAQKSGLYESAYYSQEKNAIQTKFQEVDNFFSQNAASSKPRYIPTERILLSILEEGWPILIKDKIGLPIPLLFFAQGFLEARLMVGILALTILDEAFAYEHSNGKDSIRLPSGELISLTKAASGIQSVTPLLVLLENLSRNTEQAQSFIIEEPELNLYPTAQQGLLNWLVEKCTKGENDLTITTHSPYILSSCNLLLEAYKVAQLRPDLEDEIAAIVPKACWLNPDEFAAYYVADGTVKPITDERTHLIGGNELDSVSGDISDSFRKLLRLKKQVA
ncbi:AAA family ATPase [Hymenobacter sp. BRD67]|uniref:AAA family ATPase n=1 Tax=Hymenobacter sp. BRD67 TaxID=2675877 RepID=UPI0015677C4B|nr:AAA family ATPase [Hymenobacter sp. BRD67]QKG54835.1 AAA family ATPase [Hymenobacter sp. BRD67]